MKRMAWMTVAALALWGGTACGDVVYENDFDSAVNDANFGTMTQGDWDYADTERITWNRWIRVTDSHLSPFETDNAQSMELWDKYDPGVQRDVGLGKDFAPITERRLTLSFDIRYVNPPDFPENPRMEMVLTSGPNEPNGTHVVFGLTNDNKSQPYEPLSGPGLGYMESPANLTKTIDAGYTAWYRVEAVVQAPDETNWPKYNLGVTPWDDGAESPGSTVTVTGNPSRVASQEFTRLWIKSDSPNAAGHFFIDNLALESFLTGDFDGNGAVNGLDIPDFKAALADPQGWADANPDLPHPDLLGDFDFNGAFNGLDIPGFKDTLAGTAVPEPTTTILVALGALGLVRRRR
jgi:hypothetical protein